MGDVEFLVRLTINLPADMPDDEREALLAAERKRGQELRAAGKLKRIWRLPARFANISLYEVEDATELHELVSSLPLWPWMAAEVEALARHHLEGPEGS